MVTVCQMLVFLRQRVLVLKLRRRVVGQAFVVCGPPTFFRAVVRNRMGYCVIGRVHPGTGEVRIVGGGGEDFAVVCVPLLVVAVFAGEPLVFRQTGGLAR